MAISTFFSLLVLSFIVTAETECIDKQPRCPEFSTNGLCTSKYPSVLENCEKSCNICPTTQPVTMVTTKTANNTTQPVTMITTSTANNITQPVTMVTTSTVKNTETFKTTKTVNQHFYSTRPSNTVSRATNGKIKWLLIAMSWLYWQTVNQ